MFKLSLVTLVLASIAVATPFVKRDTLTIEVVAPAPIVESVDSLILTAAVTNTGSESLKVLKYGTIFDDSIPTRSFKVTKDGAEVAFTGVQVNIDLGSLGDVDYVELAAGETRTFTHNVKALYDFESAGAGTFKFEPLGFTTKDIEVTGNAIEVEVTKDVAKRDHTLDKRIRNICTNASQTSFLTSAYNEAKTLASVAASYIASTPTGSIYTAYFKTNSATTVRSRFTAVASEASTTRTLSCTDTYGVCTGGVIAYTVIATTNVYVCSIFFNEVPSTSLCSGTTVASRNVRGGTILHELTHALSGTDDVTYGCAADQALSAANQLRNADNYNCFATQVYASTQC